jgi:thiamine biosynthesis protein ThiS
MRVTLKLYATLTDYLPSGARRDNQIQLDVEDSATVAALIATINAPPKLIHLVLVNGVFIPPSERAECTLNEADVLAIWPPIAGG